MNKRKQQIALFILCLGFFMVILDATIVNVALPSIAHGLNTNISGLQWIVAGYTLSFASLLLLAGSITDRIGGKQSLLLGLIGFLITSLACGFAPNTQTLITFRILQGAAATFLIPASLSIINIIFAEKKERARAIGVWGGIGGIAAASGPIIGSFLIAMFSWRAIFLVNVPIAFFASLLLYYVIAPTKPALRKTNLDWIGLLFSIIFTFSLALSLIEAGRYGWESTFVISAFVVALISLSIFIYVEKRVKFPTIPLEFFKSKTFSISVITGFIINFGLYGELFLLPLYFSKIKHYTVIQIGFAILPLLIFISIASYLSGKVAGRFGPKRPTLIGLIIGALGFLGLWLTTNTSLGYYWLILPLVGMGFGVAFTMPAATFIAIHSVPEKNTGIASGTFTTARQMGSLIGVAVFGSIVASSTTFMQGFHITLLAAAGIFIVGFALNLKIN